MRKNRLSLLLIAALTVAIAASIQPAALSAANVSPVQVISGEKTVTLTQADLEKMNAITAQVCFLRTTGKIEGPAAYKGVLVTDLLALVGGIDPGQAIKVTARDGYALTYSHAQVDGGLLTYDNSGKALRVGGVVMLLAYESDRDGKDKLPRLGFVGEDAKQVAITDGHFWTKGVAKIEVVPGVDDWEVRLDGIEKTAFDRATFESSVMCPNTPHPGVSWETMDKEGNKIVYEGMPLWVMISMMDGGDSPDGHYAFNDELAAKGYKVRIVSKDGFSAELDSKLIARNNDVFLAICKNGAPLTEKEAPLVLAGSALPSKKYMVKQIVSIQLIELQ